MISWEGVNIAALILAPNLLYFVLPVLNMPKDAGSAGLVFSILENIGRFGVIAILCVTKFGMVNTWSLVMAFSLCIYYGLWVRYFLKGRDYKWLFAPLFIVPIPMAVFPIIAIGSAAIWAKSIWLGLAVILFAVGHVANSWHTFIYLTKN